MYLSLKQLQQILKTRKDDIAKLKVPNTESYYIFLNNYYVQYYRKFYNIFDHDLDPELETKLLAHIQDYILKNIDENLTQSIEEAIDKFLHSLHFNIQKELRGNFLALDIDALDLLQSEKNTLQELKTRYKETPLANDSEEALIWQFREERSSPIKDMNDDRHDLTEAENSHYISLLLPHDCIIPKDVLLNISANLQKLKQKLLTKYDEDTTLNINAFILSYIQNQYDYLITKYPNAKLKPLLDVTISSLHNPDINEQEVEALIAQWRNLKLGFKDKATIIKLLEVFLTIITAFVYPIVKYGFLEGKPSQINLDKAEEFIRTGVS